MFIFHNVRELFGNKRKIREVLSCTSNFECRFGGLFETFGRINEPRDPKDVLYEVIELASSLSDFQKNGLLYFGYRKNNLFQSVTLRKELIRVVGESFTQHT